MSEAVLDIRYKNQRGDGFNAQIVRAAEKDMFEDYPQLMAAIKSYQAELQILKKE